ncbi:MAG: nucleotide pyrophosphohydrolase [Candidatus Diapherotrites archaeon]|uniref:Nucleotide pyrophosphohydrolase n=1 Tax=Candidatus Iainarchaeum sp. TaxID=3101447 RepID=A0A7J4JTW4_9ARCH|nr:nucleotide pyrophosphohydrolase [Candidatus Diapherotrites archaeon]HIH21098.1 nucleotide pyrophosphohydrolase [Candidatus Diapherotrites archaeon]
MALKEVQKKVDDWAKQFNPPYWQPLEIMARLTEEVGELARELNHIYGPKKKKSNEEIKELEDEICDIIMTLCCLANSHGIDLDEAFERTVKKLYERDSKRFGKKTV